MKNFFIFQINFQINIPGGIKYKYQYYIIHVFFKIDFKVSRIGDLIPGYIIHHPRGQSSLDVKL